MSKIPNCPNCNSEKTRHEVDYYEGEVDGACFECDECYFQWSDFRLSEKLLNLGEYFGVVAFVAASHPPEFVSQ